MFKSGKMLHGQAYIKVNDSWYLLSVIAKYVDPSKEMNPDA
jgi:hypothetical protein